MQKNKYIMEIFYFDKVTKKETIIYETFELNVDLFFSDSILMKMVKPELRYSLYKILDCQTNTHIFSYSSKKDVLIMN
jgi:hypothetical protein